MLQVFNAVLLIIVLLFLLNQLKVHLLIWENKIHDPFYVHK